jgi:hypothetical protein
MTDMLHPFKRVRRRLLDREAREKTFGGVFKVTLPQVERLREIVFRLPGLPSRDISSRPQAEQVTRVSPGQHRMITPPRCSGVPSMLFLFEGEICLRSPAVQPCRVRPSGSRAD